MKTFKKIIKQTCLLLTFGIMVVSCSGTDDGYQKDNILDPNLAPAVSFEASATSVEAGATVSFTDGSTNIPNLWTWSLPGATPNRSNEQNPVVVYEFSGTYPVTLKARNNFGANEISIDSYITVTAPPAVDINTKAQIRYTFDGANLKSDLDKGLLDIAAVTDGGAQFGIRPGGEDAYILDGANPLNIPGYTGINGAGARTVALWIKSSSTSTSGLVHWGASGTLSRASFKMQNTGVIRFEYQGGGHNGTNAINDGDWHHVAYTYDGDTVKLYVDGIEDFSVSGITVDTGNAGQTDVNIGSQLGGSVLIGSIDDVRIFDVELTPAEIVTLSEIQ